MNNYSTSDNLFLFFSDVDFLLCPHILRSFCVHLRVCTSSTLIAHATFDACAFVRVGAAPREPGEPARGVPAARAALPRVRVHGPQPARRARAPPARPRRAWRRASRHLSGAARPRLLPRSQRMPRCFLTHLCPDSA